MTLWGLISALTGVTHNFLGALDAFLLGYLQVRVLPSKSPFVNVSRTFSRNNRELYSSFRNGTSAVNLVCELLPSCGNLLSTHLSLPGLWDTPRGDGTFVTLLSG